MAKKVEKKKAEKKEVSTKEALQQAFKKDAEERQLKCSKEIDAVLQKYNCAISSEVIFSESKGVRFMKTIIPK